MSSANQLFLLADHVKLSLLERQRARSLNLDADSKDGHISRSLDQFRDGLAALGAEQKRLEHAGDEDGALSIGDNLPGLQKQYNDLISQFHGFSSPDTASTLTNPNDPALASDFAHATTATSSSAGARTSRSGSQAARFTDAPDATRDPDLEAALFGPRYSDNPDDGAGYRDETAELDNQQVHAYHQQILDQQDEQLDVLGASIARQRELSMQIGDELDDQVALLDDVDGHVDRHMSRLDRARRQVGKMSRSASDSKQMVAIVALIIILILLIAFLK